MVQKMKYLELAATIATILGYYLVTQNFWVVGLTISLFSNIGWIIWGANGKAYGLIIVNLFLMLANILALVK
jgi:hypothetical protein